MLSLPAKLKRIRSRTVGKKWRHHLSNYKRMVIFFRLSRAANSAVSGTSWPKFKVIRALMHVISTCKYEKDCIKTAEKKWRHRFLHYNPTGAYCCHENRVLAKNLMQPFPQPNDASDKILLHLRDIQCLKV